MPPTQGTVAGHATSKEAGAEGLVEQVVVFDIYTWRTLRPASLGVPGTFDHHRAYRNDRIFVSPAERDRGQSYGALADPANATEARAAVDAITGVATDEELAEMDAAELAAYVTQHHDEAARVYGFEVERKKGPRVTVMRAAGYAPVKDEDDNVTGWEQVPDGPHPDDPGAEPNGPAAVG